jgi:hypothetical protein
MSAIHCYLVEEPSSMTECPYAKLLTASQKAEIFTTFLKEKKGLELQALLILKNGVFWVVTPCGSCKNRRFGGTWRLLHQGDKNR